MRIRRKHLTSIVSATLLIGASWYFLLYPEEPWIRYNFVVRGNEINALADFLEGQSDFKKFVCVADDVWLDSTPAPVRIHEVLQNHCRAARIDMGEKTENGSFYYLGSGARGFNDYWIAVIRGTNLDEGRHCSRWQKPDPLVECIVRLSDVWAIHYLNATDLGEEAQDLAEDVARQLSRE